MANSASTMLEHMLAGLIAALIMLGILVLVAKLYRSK
jgi:tetrahydromethanopterin S-methyltransferase subunit D